jgi:hypothetical protein
MTACYLEDTNLFEDFAVIVLEAGHENGGKTFFSKRWLMYSRLQHYTSEETSLHSAQCTSQT